MYLCHFALNTSLVSHHLPRLRHICRAPPLSPLRCRCFYSDYTSFNLSCDNLWHHWHIPTLFVLGAPCYSVTFYYYYSGNSVLLCDTLQARFLCNSLCDSVVLCVSLRHSVFLWICNSLLCVTLWHSVLLSVTLILWYPDYSVYTPWSDTQLPVCVAAPSSTPLTVSHSQAAINFCFFHSQMVFSSKNTPVRSGEAARWDILLYAAQGKERNIEMFM